MLFSQRYFKAIESGGLTVDLPPEVRKKLWGWLTRYDSTFYVQRDPNDNWRDQSSALQEAEYELLTEHGWDAIPGAPTNKDRRPQDAMRHLILEGAGHFVFDAVELASGFLGEADKEQLRTKINQVLELHGCPWRLTDGEFFKLDSDFVGARLALTAHETLTANKFAGAADEFAKARQELPSGDVKDAIFYAAKSYESVLKVLTKVEHANADKLGKELITQGFLEDLPESVRQGFVDQVLKALPFLRNRLAGHGQGAEVVEVPAVYGELAIQLAAVLHNFLIAKHLARQPRKVAPPPNKAPVSALDDDIPF